MSRLYHDSNHIQTPRRHVQPRQRVDLRWLLSAIPLVVFACVALAGSARIVAGPRPQATVPTAQATPRATLTALTVDLEALIETLTWGRDTVQGTAAPGTLVEVLLDEEIVATTLADGTGIWRVNLVFDAPGPHEFSVQGRNVSGQLVGTFGPMTIIVPETVLGRAAQASPPTATPAVEALIPDWRAVMGAVAAAWRGAPAAETAMPPATAAVTPSATATAAETAAETAVAIQATRADATSRTPAPAPTRTATHSAVAVQSPTAVPPTAVPSTSETMAVSTATPVPPTVTAAVVTATFTPTATPTATLTATLAWTPTPTLEPTPTWTATALPTVTPTAPPTVAPTVTPTVTPTRAVAQQRSTPQAAPALPAASLPENPRVTLLSPEEMESGNGRRTFAWDADFELPPNVAFELVFWKENRDPLQTGFGLAPPTRATSLSVDLNELDHSLGNLLQPGLYQWGVLLVQVSPYQRLAFLGDAHHFRFDRTYSQSFEPFQRESVGSQTNEEFIVASRVYSAVVRIGPASHPAHFARHRASGSDGRDWGMDVAPVLAPGRGEHERHHS